MSPPPPPSSLAANLAQGAAPASTRRWSWLPAPGTWGYYALLAALGMLVLGPLGGVTASYMNFSLGFFVGGQVLAGILGSSVTYGYGAEGKHGANYMQTAAASVASMSAMGVLIQAMSWLGMPPPPTWELIAYMLCIGMFGAGVGMLYTPILVDRMRLNYPSGLAVANILRALTDKELLKRSIAKLGGGALLGLAGGIGSAKLAWLGAIDLSSSTFGAGMIVGPRIGIAALAGGMAGVLTKPYFVSIGWLQPTDPFRKITFLIALGMIMGAALIDIGLILYQGARRLRLRVAVEAETTASAQQQPQTKRLLVWVAFWGLALSIIGADVLHVTVGYLLFAVALVFVFAMVNGIALGISDSTPISSAFVVTVVLMAALGLRDPAVGLMAAAVLLVAVAIASDMQQDRSTGWRLGTNRTIQFRYQVAGILVGAFTAILFARLFMAAYPVLTLDQTTLPQDAQPHAWSSTMTYKFVGALRSLTDDKPYQRTAIWIGVLLGLVTEVVRKVVLKSGRWQRWAQSSRPVAVLDFVLDSTVLSSPYASSFGGFLNIATSSYFAAGGVLAGLVGAVETHRAKSAKQQQNALPSDMSNTSLVGGGLIAGDALAALGLGIAGLLSTVAG